jgi:hypothetical protein
MIGLKAWNATREVEGYKNIAVNQLFLPVFQRWRAIQIGI